MGWGIPQKVGTIAVMSGASGGGRYFAIGDVHGCADELKELLGQLPLTPEDTVVFLGDYVDRGNQSREVIDMILELRKIHRVVHLQGNHEEMLLDFLKDPHSRVASQFIFNGGSSTLASYADDKGVWEIPEEHKAFYRELPCWHVTEEYVFVHAGLPLTPLKKINPTRDRRKLLWTRGKFLTTDYSWGKVVVHGHTPVAVPTITPNRINVDTGCVYGRYLTAVELPSRKLYSVARHKQERMLLREGGSNRRAVRFDGAIPVFLDLEEGRFAFETLNYSEIGMLLRQVDGAGAPEMESGRKIRGEVQPKPGTSLHFEARVVRLRKYPDGKYYAIELLGPFKDNS